METAKNNFESFDGKSFDWIEHEGKRYANQRQFADLLGIKPQNLKRWINKHRFSMTDLITVPKHNQDLFFWIFKSVESVDVILFSPLNNSFSAFVIRCLSV